VLLAAALAVGEGGVCLLVTGILRPSVKSLLALLLARSFPFDTRFLFVGLPVFLSGLGTDLTTEFIDVGSSSGGFRRCIIYAILSLLDTVIAITIVITLLVAVLIEALVIEVVIPAIAPPIAVSIPAATAAPPSAIVACTTIVIISSIVIMMGQRLWSSIRVGIIVIP
jgi:hypothetical protein